jgi:putative tricarboxylic transport membrane protein
MGSGILVDRVIGFLVLLLAAAVAVGGSRIEYSFSSDPLGPRAFPVALACVAAICAGWLILRPSPQVIELGRPASRVVGLTALSVVSAGLFPIAGFIIAIFVLCAGAALLFGATRRGALLVGLGNAVGLWLAFTQIFEIPLPPNPLLGF